MGEVRPAAVAGTFYPGAANALAAQVDALLGGTEPVEPQISIPKALIVPHAGYIYSGAVAGRAFAALAAARGSVTRVVLLGPVHRVPVRGLALPGASAFDTPLGRVPIDQQSVTVLRGLPQVVTSPAAHALEHSLEVQLPFLQRVLGSFSLLPLAVGAASVAEVAEVIERLWGERETLVVVSTDLSHYHSYGEAKRIDAASVARIASFTTDLDHEEACGATPLNGLLRVARARGLSIRLLDARNSGDTAGERDRVVGYSAFALYDKAEELTHHETGRTLIGIARAAIDGALDAGSAGGASLRLLANPAWLARPGASFVTLTMDGALRGCIGSLQAERPLGEDVAANALHAAFRDPRFPALTRAEWPRVETEVSLLSTARPMRFADEADLLAQVRPGEDGLILECAGRRGTFLPQVWESLPDKRRFLEELRRKAGLPADTPLARCRLSRYQVRKWRESDVVPN
ncbi:MAG TPA: AmmeMemoRadiSam system protein B [Burkholderiales bacterium]|nr:AmmeMemoRadiSam system protein B [Burkholderiales bacterium]